MSTLFGHRLEPDFNEAKEGRRDHLKWLFYAGLLICIVYLFLGWPYALQIFQGWLATSFFYGENFYVRRRAHLGKPWLRKAIIATIPFHAVYLTALFWSDHAFPQVMTKAMVFIPVLALGFAIESVQMGRIIDRFKLTSMKQESGSPVS